MKLTGGIIALFLRNVLSKGHRSALIKTHPLFGRLALNPWPLSKRFRAPSFNVQLGGPLRLSICLFTDVTASPVARDEKAPCISARPGFTLIIVPFFFFFFSFTWIVGRDPSSSSSSSLSSSSCFFFLFGRDSSVEFRFVAKRRSRRKYSKISIVGKIFFVIWREGGQRETTRSWIKRFDENSGGIVFEGTVMTAICWHCANQSRPQSDNGVENGPRDCNERTTIIRIGWWTRLFWSCKHSDLVEHTGPVPGSFAPNYAKLVSWVV